MKEQKLKCEIKCYEDTYFEIGQVWETRDENIKAKIIKILANDNMFPIICEYYDSFENRMFESTVDTNGRYNKSFKHRYDLVKL